MSGRFADPRVVDLYEATAELKARRKSSATIAENLSRGSCGDCLFRGQLFGSPASTRRSALVPRSGGTGMTSGCRGC